MHTQFKIGDPSKIPATMTITAPVCDFIALGKQLDRLETEEWSAWPLSGIRKAIEEIIGDVNKHFYSITMPEENPTRDSE